MAEKWRISWIFVMAEKMRHGLGYGLDVIGYGTGIVVRADAV